MPQRTCVVCRAKGEADAFFRMVAGPARRIACELGSRLPGRGAHCCLKAECIAKLGDSGRLAAGLRQKDIEVNPGEIAQRVRSLLGQSIRGMLIAARKKGALALGSDAVLQKLKAHARGMLLIARDLSPATLTNLKREAEGFYILPLEMGEVGETLLRRPVGALFVEDARLAGGIRLRAAQAEAVGALGDE